MNNLSIKELTPEYEVAWDEYVISKRASLYHLSVWRNIIKNSFGHKNIYLFCLNENNKVCGVLPLVRIKSVLFGDYILSVPYFNYGGVVADSIEITKALLDKAEVIKKDLGSAHIEYRNINEISTDMANRQDKVTMLLNLPNEPDELWKAIGSKRRAQVKRPIREGAEFKIGGIELLNDFYKVFSINMRDLGTPVYSKRFFAEILNRLPKASSLIVVYIKGIPVGAGFLLKHLDTVEIPWASTLREYNRYGINMFMYWNILKYSIEQNFKVFDFGRSSKDSGTLKFKKQWGAEQKQLNWYYSLNSGNSIPVLNHTNKKFELLINIWKKLPVKITNLIGPHIVKNLP